MPSPASEALDSASVIVLALGRRGAVVQFGQEAAAALGTMNDLRGIIVMSEHADIGSAAVPGSIERVRLFRKHSGAILASWRIPQLRRRLRQMVIARRAGTVIDMMPHIWSPMLVRPIQATGARYVAVAHDAADHPGDWTARAARWSERALPVADEVVALSDVVAERLVRYDLVQPDRIRTLFHPNFSYTPPRKRERAPGVPLRLLFLGRIMPYKGLPLLVEAVETLRSRGVAVTLDVFGDGPLGALGPRLAALGGEVVNRWLQDADIARALDRADVMVLSHVEASQSGIVAAAHGAGLPVIATPVGALPEQIADDIDGLIAAAPSAEALATAIGRVAMEPVLFERIAGGALAAARQRSMPEFLRAIVSR